MFRVIFFLITNILFNDRGLPVQRSYDERVAIGLSLCRYPMVRNHTGGSASYVARVVIFSMTRHGFMHDFPSVSGSLISRYRELIVTKKWIRYANDI